MSKLIQTTSASFSHLTASLFTSSYGGLLSSTPKKNNKT